jgi:hypothetical protein
MSDTTDGKDELIEFVILSKGTVKLAIPIPKRK